MLNDHKNTKDQIYSVSESKLTPIVSNEYSPIIESKMDKLKKSNEFVNSILYNLNSTLFIVDPERRIHSYNDNNNFLFTKSEQEIIGVLFGNSVSCTNAVHYKSDCGTTPKCDACGIRKNIVKCFNSTSPSRNNHLMHEFTKDGSSLQAEFMFSAKHINYKNEIYALIIVDDITELEKQKRKITKQRDEILGSISYAKRIQKAVLPMQSMIKNILEDYFVLYKPRDIVSGDFYFVSQVNDWKIVIVADCTGHGVPGAFMSLLSITFLKKIIEKDEIAQPNMILNELRKDIISALRRENKTLSLIDMNEKTIETIKESLSDGLDISVCAINTKTNEMQFSGANNSVYIIRDKELIEYKGDRMPVGYYLKMDDFSNKSIEMKNGDMVYMSSDGFPDQFGGPKGKKMKYRVFKQLLIDSANLPIKEQSDILYQEFINWKGEHQQIDDVVVLGFKV